MPYKSDWLLRARSFFRKHSDNYTTISAKLALVERGLRRGSIFFPGNDFPFVKLPQWYIDTLLKGNLDRETEKRMLEVIEERQALFYLLNEITYIENKGKKR